MVVPMSVMNQRPEQELFEEVARIMGIAESFVEKDWYVTQIIGVIAGIQQSGVELVFSGGTALSKAHQLLRRFSEDIDFRISVQKGAGTRKSRSAFKRQIVDTLRESGFSIEDAHVTARDENRFFSIDVTYDSYFPPAQTLRPHILIELTVRDTQLPPLFLPVSSFVNTLAKRPPEVASIGCIDPVESAADKLSAIVWRIPDRVRGGQDDDPSLVRHIHDLAILKDLALSHSDFPSLVAAAMQQDLNRSKHDALMAELPTQEKFQRMLDMLRADHEYAREYEKFVQGVSYAAPGETPGFKEAVEALHRLIKALGPEAKA